MRLLDLGEAVGVSDSICDLQDELGFSDEEFIPGLIQAVVTISQRSKHTFQLLDEAADLLADGGVDE